MVFASVLNLKSLQLTNNVCLLNFVAVILSDDFCSGLAIVK